MINFDLSMVVIVVIVLIVVIVMFSNDLRLPLSPSLPPSLSRFTLRSLFTSRVLLILRALFMSCFLSPKTQYLLGQISCVSTLAVAKILLFVTHIPPRSYSVINYRIVAFGPSPVGSFFAAIASRPSHLRRQVLFKGYCELTT
jgi:hypothetical protein